MSKEDGEGYFTQIDYMPGYFRQLNPRHVDFALLVEGLDTLPPGPCCELGFGQGVSLALHAAGDSARAWWGTDLMPTHARHAQQLVDATGVPATVAGQDFADFFARDDLPQFAFIALHGVWSWVSARSRALIADFLRRRLLPGGVAYISYNTQVAWAGMVPLRQLMLQHDQALGTAAQTPAERVRAAAQFVDQMLAIDNPLAQANPGVRAQFAELHAKSPEYLLHELMNRDWHPTSLGEVIADLRDTQLSWATSTELQQRRTALHLSAAQQQALARLPGPGLREAAFDLFTGQRLRRDLFVRGPRRLSAAEQRERLFATPLVLAQPTGQVPGKLAGPAGEEVIAGPLLTGLVDALSAAPGPVALGELCRQAHAQGSAVADAMGLASYLVGTGSLQVAQEAAQTARSRPATDRLNAHLLHRATLRQDIQVLASPVTGGGVLASAMHQRMLSACLADPKRPDAWAAQVAAGLLRSGQHLQRDGKDVSDPAAMTQMLAPVVEQFRQQQLPVFKRLQVV